MPWGVSAELKGPGKLLRIRPETLDFGPDLGLTGNKTKPKISGTVPTDRHTTSPNDSGRIAAFPQLNERNLNCEIAQPRGRWSLQVGGPAGRWPWAGPSKAVSFCVGPGGLREARRGEPGNSDGVCRPLKKLGHEAPQLFRVLLVPGRPPPLLTPGGRHSPHPFHPPGFTGAVSLPGACASGAGGRRPCCNSDHQQPTHRG